MSPYLLLLFHIINYLSNEMLSRLSNLLFQKAEEGAIRVPFSAFYFNT